MPTIRQDPRTRREYDLRFGTFALAFGVGVTRTNRYNGRSLHFQPSEDCGQFCDELETHDERNPDTLYAKHLTETWPRYR